MIRSADPLAPGPRALSEAHRALVGSLFLAEGDHALAPDAPAGPDVFFLAAFADGGAVGCAAPARGGGHGEVRAMLVAPEARGAGLGARLLAAVEEAARAEGVRRPMPGTGASLTAARGLHERAGCRERGPFGGHASDPHSVFMENDLGAGDPG